MRAQDSIAWTAFIITDNTRGDNSDGVYSWSHETGKQVTKRTSIVWLHEHRVTENHE